ncbi:hypothetical protein L0U85_12205 [Glycomyces sp. L485]|uniref:hypothetical protein n=1 Tax=Glycomyces sp. L485 TaxID=2909235 RepID=UPI001F4AFB84|nr:hypothetical protein [Glycomyces sp. L485]MCH7231607.1 hypothetical protein [Glycomyces sp. L485]
MASELKIYLPGAQASGDARRALKIMDGIFDVLDKLDASELRDQSEHVQWRFTQLGVGSVNACTAIEEPRPNQSLEEAESLLPLFVLGLKFAQENASIPKGWDYDAAKKARTVFKALGELRVELQVIGDDATEPCIITREAGLNLDKALQAKMETIGSLTGRLESVNFHDGKREARLWLEAPKRAVTVQFEDEQADQVTAALRKRVQVSGVIQRDRTRQAQSIKLRSLRVMKGPERSTLTALDGAFPDLTGGQTVDEYLEELRGTS